MKLLSLIVVAFLALTLLVAGYALTGGIVAYLWTNAVPTHPASLEQGIAAVLLLTLLATIFKR